jgi:hypothetical protein
MSRADTAVLGDDGGLVAVIHFALRRSGAGRSGGDERARPHLSEGISVGRIAGRRGRASSAGSRCARPSTSPDSPRSSCSNRRPERGQDAAGRLAREGPPRGSARRRPARAERASAMKRSSRASGS